MLCIFFIIGIYSLDVVAAQAHSFATNCHRSTHVVGRTRYLATGLGISGGGLPMRADMPIVYQAKVMRETLNRLTPDQQENLIEAISLALGLPVPPNPALHAVEPRAA
jgi:hypothetical protein